MEGLGLAEDGREEETPSCTQEVVGGVSAGAGVR